MSCAVTICIGLGDSPPAGGTRLREPIEVNSFAISVLPRDDGSQTGPASGLKLSVTRTVDAASASLIALCLASHVIESLTLGVEPSTGDDGAGPYVARFEQARILSVEHSGTELDGRVAESIAFVAEAVTFAKAISSLSSTATH